MATISTHNGSRVSAEHNRRNRAITDKEEHIRKDGQYEIWKDEDVRKAYDRLFGESLKRYNEKVKAKHPERQIKSYYAEVEKDEKQHPVYEMIIGVYDEETPEETKRAIMKEFVDTWQERNPNLILVGAYYHNDEQGEKGGHVHIDYIPVAHGYKRGLDTQAGLVKAFEEQGIKNMENGITAQIQWERKQNQYLEKLCKAHSVSVEHPKENLKHEADKEAYILKQKVKAEQKELNKTQQILCAKNSQVARMQAKLDKIQGKYRTGKKSVKISRAAYTEQCLNRQDLDRERQQMQEKQKKREKELQEQHEAELERKGQEHRSQLVQMQQMIDELTREYKSLRSQYRDIYGQNIEFQNYLRNTNQIPQFNAYRQEKQRQREEQRREARIYEQSVQRVQDYSPSL